MPKHLGKSKFRKLIIIALLIAVSSLILIKQQSAKAAYDANFANFWVGRVTPGSGHIGVDLWWPGGGSEYNPCHHSNDAYYDACVLSNAAQTSYYKVMSYTPSGTDFPYGIFLDNQNADFCTTAPWCRTAGNTGTVRHGWVTLISDGSLEVYPHVSGGSYNPSANTVGGVRITASFFHFANGGRYSPDIGNIALPQLGEANVGKLNGFATYNGVKAANNRMLIEAFQRDESRFTSTGYIMRGFTSVRNNNDGYFNTGALPSGKYLMFITDTSTGRKIILDNVNIFSTYERLDFKLEQSCFGYPQIQCTDPA